jgi:dienelactone hydrolase
MLLLALLACRPHTGEAPDEIAPTEETDTAADTDAPPSTDACAPDHALIGITPRVVAAEKVADWSYAAWQIDLWLNLNNLGWLTPSKHDVDTWRIRYTTQDRGVETEATALVSFPRLAAVEARGTVLWLHGTSGFDDACAPSSGDVAGLIPPIVSAGRGYVAVAPDYLGLNGLGADAVATHPWIVGEPTGLVALDALRAVTAWLPTIDAKARVDGSRIVYWGWSEGGYTALQADRRAPSYAPEVAPIGVIAAVPPIDIRGQVAAGVDALQPATTAGAIVLAQHANWYGETALDAVLTPALAAALPNEVAASCDTFPTLAAATSPESIYSPAFLAAMRSGTDLDPWTCWLDRSSIASHALPYTGDAPVLLISAAADTLVPEAPIRAAIPKLCAEGYAIEHVSCAGEEHGDSPVSTLKRQIDWLDARMNGAAAPAGCAVAAPGACGE